MGYTEKSYVLDVHVLGKEKIASFISDKTGWGYEKSYLELTMPKVGKKSKFISREFGFSSLIGLDHNTGKPTKHAVAKFVSENTGADYESCYMKLSMPPVKSFAKDSLNSVRTYTPGELLSMRGFGGVI